MAAMSRRFLSTFVLLFLLHGEFHIKSPPLEMGFTRWLYSRSLLE